MLREQKNTNTISHFGVRGMKWGVRKDRSGGRKGGEAKSNGSTTTSPKDAKGTSRYKKAAEAHNRAQKAVESADDAWVDAFSKGDKRAMKLAEASLKRAQDEAKVAKKAMKRAAKTDDVLQAEKKRSKARKEFEKADNAWVDAWSKNGGKVDPAADRAFNEARQNLKKAKKEVYNAKVKPFNESVNAARKKQDAAWDALVKVDQEWTAYSNSTKGGTNKALGEKFNAAQKAYNQATSDLRKEKRSRTFARGSAFVENIFN